MNPIKRLLQQYYLEALICPPKMIQHHMTAECFKGAAYFSKIKNDDLIFIIIITVNIQLYLSVIIGLFQLFVPFRSCAF